MGVSQRVGQAVSRIVLKRGDYGRLFRTALQDAVTWRPSLGSISPPAPSRYPIAHSAACSAFVGVGLSRKIVQGLISSSLKPSNCRDRGCLIEPFEGGCGWCGLETFECLGGGSLFEAFELGCRRSRGDCGGGLDGWCAFDGWGGAEPVVVIFDLEGFTSDPCQGTDQRYCKKEIFGGKNRIGHLRAIQSVQHVVRHEVSGSSGGQQ